MLTKIPGANYHMLVIYQDLTYFKKNKQKKLLMDRIARQECLYLAKPAN